MIIVQEKCMYKMIIVQGKYTEVIFQGRYIVIKWWLKKANKLQKEVRVHKRSETFFLVDGFVKGLDSKTHVIA